MSTDAIRVTYAKAPVPSCFEYTKLSITQRIKAVANERLGPSSSPDSRQTLELIGQQPQNYDFFVNLAKAYEFLETQENFSAEMIFREILTMSKGVDFGKDSLLATHCLLGIAYATKSSVHSTEALAALTGVKDNNGNWMSLDVRSISKAFLELRTCYRLLLPLIPLNETTKIQDISGEIDRCSILIRKEDLFDDKVREADRCVQRMELNEARFLYREASQIKVPPDGFRSLAAISCELKYASTLSKNSPERDDPLKKAETRLNESFSNRSGCPEELQPQFLESLVDLFTKLLTLLPEDYKGREEIQKNLETCESEHSKVAISTGKRKVSTGFPSSIKYAIVFCRCLVLFLACVGAYTLAKYSRSVYNNR